MKLVAKPLKAPEPGSARAIPKGKLMSTPPVMNTFNVKTQPRQVVGLPGGGFTVVNTKTWW